MTTLKQATGKFAFITASVLIALTLHGYLNTPWMVGGVHMGNRINCVISTPWWAVSDGCFGSGF